jgi:hypothetical protein
MDNKKGRSTSSVGNGLNATNTASSVQSKSEVKDPDSTATNQYEPSEVELGVLEQKSYIVENNLIPIDENAASSSTETKLEVVDDSTVAPVETDANIEIVEDNNQIKADSNTSEEFEIDLDEGMTEAEARIWRKRFVSACR